jgi:hypothetical protein
MHPALNVRQRGPQGHRACPECRLVTAPFNVSDLMPGIHARFFGSGLKLPVPLAPPEL